MCGKGGLLGALIGAALAPVTFGASLLPGALTGSVAGGAVGAAAGSALIDKPQEAADGALAEQQAVNERNKAEATAAADKASAAVTKADAKSPDIAGMRDANAMNARGGQSGTMLTGPQGVDPNSLLLGKKTLLGS
jgi:hypothetical protein